MFNWVRGAIAGPDSEIHQSYFKAQETLGLLRDLDYFPAKRNAMVMGLALKETPIRLDEFNNYGLTLQHVMDIPDFHKVGGQAELNAVMANPNQYRLHSINRMVEMTKKSRIELSAFIGKKKSGIPMILGGVSIVIDPTPENLTGVFTHDVGSLVESGTGRRMGPLDAFTTSPQFASKNIQGTHNESFANIEYGEFYFSTRKSTKITPEVVEAIEQANQNIRQHRLSKGLPEELSTGYTPWPGDRPHIENSWTGGYLEQGEPTPYARFRPYQGRKDVGEQIKERRAKAIAARQAVPRGVVPVDPLVLQAQARSEFINAAGVKKLTNRLPMKTYITHKAQSAASFLVKDGVQVLKSRKGLLGTVKGLGGFIRRMK